MTIISSAWSYPNSGGFGLGDTYDISYDNSNGGCINDNTNTWGEWSYAGSGYETGQTIIVGGFDLNPTATEYGIAAVTQIDIGIENMLTTQSGDSYIALCPTTSAWTYSGGDEYYTERSWSSGSTTKHWLTFVEGNTIPGDAGWGWGLTYAAVENIFNGVSGWGVRLRWDFDSGGTARDARIYRVRMRFWEDDTYEPPAGAGGALLGSSF